MQDLTNRKITIVGIGYVGLSNAVLLSQHNKVYTVDIQPERVYMVNNHHSPIRDKEIEEYLTHKSLDLTATTNAPTSLPRRRLHHHLHPHQLRSGQKLLRHLLRRVSHRGSPENQP